MPAQGSAFVVFRDKQKANRDTIQNFPKPIKSIPITGTWKVTFTKPDSTSFVQSFDRLWDWSRHPDKQINYFSGSATYELALPQITAADKGHRLVLSLGKIIAVGRVFVNGKEVGPVWTSPYEIDITDFCTEKSNTVAIKVTNTWANNLIGEKQLPENERKLWTIVDPYNTDSPLHNAGLLGPASIKVYRQSVSK